MGRNKEAAFIGATLFSPGRSKLILDLSSTYRELAIDRGEGPYNTRKDVFGGIGRILQERALVEDPEVLSRPYWGVEMPYRLHDIVGTSVQFFDEHRQPLPTTTLVPADDIVEYRDYVLSQDHPLSIPEQFEGLLDIAHDNIVGAANLGMLASRLYARGGDLRAYSGVFNTSDITEWNKHIRQFDTRNEDGINDGPGDTYYFWTHFFVASSTSALGGPLSRGVRKVFAAGTPTMRAVRHLVGSWTVSDHKEASILGRQAANFVVQAVLRRE